MSSKHDQDKSADYVSYLVRLWRVGSEGEPQDQEWRASLEEPLTQQIRRFEDLQSLFHFLKAQTGHPATGNHPSAITED